MIARLRGEVLEADSALVVIDCGGVGYEALVPARLALSLPVGSRADIFVKTIAREDALLLYGFATPRQRRLFDQLTSVKSCGAKTALAILDEFTEEDLLRSIVAKDAKALVKASGVGPKLAERIIVELKDKLADEALATRAAVETLRPERVDELVGALLGLGYRRAEAEAAADAARNEAEDEQGQLKTALRILSK